MRPLALASLALAACADPTPTETGDNGTGTPVEPRVCSGFSDTPETWALDTPLIADFFMYSRDGLGQYWSLYDLTGDGLPDLVQHAHGNNAAAEEMGEAWYVWPGTGTGFASRVDWTLPLDHRELDGFHAPNSVQTVLDINGDGFADLVRARNPDGGRVFGEGTNPHWAVHLGDGATGFATEVTEWSIPELATANEVYEGGTHTVRDIDGDGAVELIETSGSATNFGGLERPHWRVYEAEADGFASTYREWALPAVRVSTQPDYVNWVNTAQRWHSTQDVTGDGLPDLVVPREKSFPYAVYGQDPDWHWRVHPNLGDRFAEAPLHWSIPDPLFTNANEAADPIYPTSRQWSTMSIGGGDPVLVVTRDPETEEPFVEDGQPIWAIFDATGPGFTDEHDAWSVPDAVFTTLWSDAGGSAEGWLVTDMDADGCSDLVLTAGLDMGEPVAGEGWQWRVYKGE